MIVAVWLVVMVPAFAVNVALVAPAGTLTDAGIVSSALLLKSVITAPPVGAAWPIVAVHVEVAPLFSDEGLQVTLLMPGGPTVMVPPIALVPMLVPVADAANVPVMLIGIVPDALEDRVTLIAATVPFWIRLAFKPLTMHVRVPMPAEQVIVFEAAVAALPIVALRFAMLDALYVRVHCTAAGSLPLGDVRLRFKLLLPPALMVPEDNANVSVWANDHAEKTLHSSSNRVLRFRRPGMRLRSSDSEFTMPLRLCSRI